MQLSSNLRLFTKTFLHYRKVLRKIIIYRKINEFKINPNDINKKSKFLFKRFFKIDSTKKTR